MMRFTQLTTLGAAALLVVPAATLQESDATGLQAALDRTARALEALRALESEVTAGEPTAIERLLQVTQRPALDAPSRDERVHVLRNDVSALRQHLDELEAERGDPTTRRPEDTKADPAAGEPGAAAGVHTGLQPSDLARLRTDPPPIPGADPEALRADRPRRFEPAGFSADPVLHGRAYYKAGRYAEALALFEQRPDDLRARYWSAHSLERLGKTDAALALYRALAATDPEAVVDPDDAALVERAARDAEFLEWRRAFDLRLKTLAEGQER